MKNINDSINQNVIIVAARLAILDYENYSCYICQENRKFRTDSKYMTFYYNNKISKYVPQILGYIESININCTNSNQYDIINISSTNIELTELLDSFLKKEKNNPRWTIGKNKIIFLTKPEDSRTIILPQEIINNKTDSTGTKRVPFTQSNRYCTLTKLISSYYTKELE